MNIQYIFHTKIRIISAVASLIKLLNSDLPNNIMQNCNCAIIELTLENNPNPVKIQYNISYPMDQVLFSSISRKFVMALAGIFLLLFLPVHLYINLMLLQSDPLIYNKAAKFMGTFPLVRVLEVILIFSLIVHFTWGIIVQVQNWLARPESYARVNRSETSFFSRFMIWTGAAVLTFLALHFFNFFFIKLGLVAGDPEDFYTLAHNLFKIPAYNYIYLISFALLGLHLYHAIFSASLTLGLEHRIWTPVVKIFSVLYAIFIPAGFAFISITLWLFR
jgi:succinate dehydrogenase / fumarate reductase, cytochrome b subunit